MNTSHSTCPNAIDRAQVESVLYRVAVSALTWYPDKTDADHDYRIEQDQRWCLAPMQGVDVGLPIRVLVASTIMDPSRYRAELVCALAALGGDQGER